ncbi:hypothetical protein NBRC10512_000061 [Rhodotorula toruloides]|uniref:RHTO0S09e04214g1_1 n=2 Tax=Rhodotorula toruloides TaxID=5286 RepID=A0A061B968_RHOTO|nr:uncharacterized protein RHTO_07746 [Rhodotorula toruloides NP11]EMS22876.1 hypothetical protein RHTO_07746 [Rhodotorula toruloides NP11]CDR44433.1 RHTO0S09e04214g1_1 [Rhodotorula toruloides]
MASNGDDRPSIRDANLALASLLTALKQSGNSPASASHNAAQSSPAAQQHCQHVVQSSPAYTPAASSVANALPTPSAQTAADLSELGTYELLLQLGAHLGVMGTPQDASASQAGQASAPQAGPSRVPGVGMVGGKAPKNRSMHEASTSALAGPSTDPHLGMVYHPQPTRSGRVPQAPSNNSTTDPSTVLFNDFFDFPSDDEEEDPDFDPNDPMVDFWGDLLSKERADGDVTENEGDWAGGNTQGITGDEFAREIALLTSTLDDPLPTVDGLDVSGRGRATSSATPPTLRSSPRRRATGIPVTQSAPRQTSPRRRRRGLSPVPEDPDAHATTSGFQYDPPLSLHQQLALHPLLNYQQNVDPNLQLPLPPASTASTATTSIADEPEEPAPKKKRTRKRKYTPEEAAARRKEQEKERQAKRRKTEKQRKQEREQQFEQLEVENKELKEKCAALEERVRDLEWRLREKRRMAGGVGAEAADEGGEEEESDGGEYQVQSSDESSSEEDSEGEGQDAAAYIGAVAAELDQLQQVTSPPQPSPAPYQPPAPAPLNLNLANIGQDALSQLLSIVHTAAKQQGIALANSPAS